MTWVSGCAASADAAIDNTGVIPDPAAIRPWCVPGASSGVNEPAGGATSIASPGETWSTSHSEKSPPSTRRTPTFGSAPAGAQIEYEDQNPEIHRIFEAECERRGGEPRMAMFGT